MNKYKIIILSAIVLVLMSFTTNKREQLPNTVLVKIDFGGLKEVKEAKVNWEDNLTALEALQHTATVETYSANQFVIVTSIDGIKGKRGEMAWYYEVNGKPAKKLAINNTLSPDDTITWIYKTDVCSKTVDK